MMTPTFAQEKRPSVLLVCRGFPPYIRSLGGAMRMLKLAEFLDRNGWRVHVVAGAGPFVSDYGYRALLDRLSITYIDDVALRPERPVEQGGQGDAGLGRRIKSFLTKRAKAVIMDVSTPDLGVFSLPRVLRAASSVVANNDVRAVITSGPPHSDHLVGLRLKARLPDLYWIADYRDSWNGTPLFRKRLALLQAVNERLERSVLAHCDSFTYVSSPMLKKVQELYSGHVDVAKKAMLVMNGFDEEMLEVLQAPVEPECVEGRLVLGYFGAVSDDSNSYRNPASILRVLEANPDIPVRLEFYGNTRIDPEWKARLGNRVHLGGGMSHADALAKMARMHGLVLLHTKDEGADEVITGKVFEYIASGRPILSVGPRDMAVNDLLSGDSLTFVARHDDEKSLIEALRSFVAIYSRENRDRRPRSEVVGFSRQTQYLNLLGLLGRPG